MALLSVHAFATSTSLESGSRGNWKDGYVVGAEGAINLASSNATGASREAKFIGGVYVDWHLTEAIALRPELLYLSLSPDFLALPIMGAWKFDTGTMVKPYVFAGPEVAFRIGSNPVGGGVKTLNFSIDAGAGLDVEITPQFLLGMNARYAFGLTNIADTAGADVKTRSIYLLASAGYRF
jgi:hypothetical protein